jgi:single-strand DNA-binding protein
MAGSVNRVILIGNLGADPDLKYTPSNQAVCNLSLATSESFKDKSGQRQEKTEWHRVVAWGTTAENVAKYQNKGSTIYVEGRLQTTSWDDKEGKKRYSTDVVADRIVFLGGGNRGAQGRNTERTEAPKGPPDDDLAF